MVGGGSSGSVAGAWTRARSPSRRSIAADLSVFAGYWLRWTEAGNQTRGLIRTFFQDPRWTRVSFGRIVNEKALEPAGRHAWDLFSAGRAHRDNARCHRYVMRRHPEDTKRAEFRWYPKTSGHGFTGCRWSGRAETSDWSVSGGRLTGFDHCIEALQPALRQCSHQTQDFTRLPSRVPLSMRTTKLEGPVLASLRRARRPG